ncbi:hypothetical protein ES332_D04G055100v1, partial [Gossypium tomentosum]
LPFKIAPQQFSSAVPVPSHVRPDDDETRTLSDDSRNGASVWRARSAERGTVWRLLNVGNVVLLIAARISAVLG